MGISLIVESFHFENISRSELNIHTNELRQNRGTSTHSFSDEHWGGKPRNLRIDCKTTKSHEKTNKRILSGVSFYTGDSRYYLTLKSFVYLLVSFFLLCSSPNLRMLSKILKVIFNYLLPESRQHLAYLTQCTALTLSFGCFCPFEELFYKVYEGKENDFGFFYQCYTIHIIWAYLPFPVINKKKFIQFTSITIW